MQCPIDQTELVISERQGIEIDYCPKCRGVWLDRGELDKIIDRTAAVVPTEPAPRQERPRAAEAYGHHQTKRKKSLLSELFDF